MVVLRCALVSSAILRSSAPAGPASSKMTQETLLTNSQEQQLYMELGQTAEDRKAFGSLGEHLDIIPGLDHYASISNFDLEPQSSFLTAPYEDEQNLSHVIDDKNSLRQIMMEQQRQQQQLQQQQLEQQQLEQQQQQQQYLQQQQQQFVPAVPLATPIQCKQEYAGEYNFQLILNHENASKHWVYSEQLQKVFIHMEQVLPLQFSWEPPRDGLWVRATMVYKQDHHRSQPVLRCHNHMAPDNSSNRNINPLQVKHVIRCTNNVSSYHERNGHLSVVSPLGHPQAGVTTVPMDYIFFCKNSCASGMNRRATELIFTLETQDNVILGRRVLEVRVCSCPKRDKEKEEGEVVKPEKTLPVTVTSKKRKMVNVPTEAPPPPGKKIMADSKVYNLAHVQVVGRENYLAVLKFAHDVMAGSACRTNNPEPYKPYMDSILKKLG